MGLSAGLLVAVKTAGDKYSAYIKKVKQKGREDSTQDVHFKPILGTSTPKLSKRITRKEKRAQRKLLRLEKK